MRGVIISYVQEIKLRRDNLVARICHPVNLANTRKHCSNTKLIESIEEDSVLKYQEEGIARMI